MRWPTSQTFIGPTGGNDLSEMTTHNEDAFGLLGLAETAEHEIRAILQDTTTKLNKTDVANFDKSVTDLMAIVAKLAVLAAKKESEPKTGKVNTYAQIAAKNTKTTEKHICIITGMDTEDPENLKTELKSIMDPEKENIKVRNIYKGRNKLIIETDTKEDVDRILKNERIAISRLKAETLKKRNPLIIVRDIEKIKREEVVIEQIKKHTLRNLQENEKEINIKFKTFNRNKENLENWVLEVSPKVYNEIKNSKHIFFKWESKYWENFISPRRCFRCQKYGHVSKFCKAEKPACGWCSGEHETRECKKDKEFIKCSNCIVQKVRKT